VQGLHDRALHQIDDALHEFQQIGSDATAMMNNILRRSSRDARGTPWSAFHPLRVRSPTRTPSLRHQEATFDGGGGSGTGVLSSGARPRLRQLAAFRLVAD